MASHSVDHKIFFMSSVSVKMNNATYFSEHVLVRMNIVI